jgi:hypothetical protein
LGLRPLMIGSRPDLHARASPRLRAAPRPIAAPRQDFQDRETLPAIGSGWRAPADSVRNVVDLGHIDIGPLECYGFRRRHSVVTSKRTHASIGDLPRQVAGKVTAKPLSTRQSTGVNRTGIRGDSRLGSLPTGLPESPRKKSGRPCRIGAEVFVVKVRGRPRGAAQRDKSQRERFRRP